MLQWMLRAMPSKHTRASRPGGDQPSSAQHETGQPQPSDRSSLDSDYYNRSTCITWHETLNNLRLYKKSNRRSYNVLNFQKFVIFGSKTMKDGVPIRLSDLPTTFTPVMMFVLVS